MSAERKHRCASRTAATRGGRRAAAPVSESKQPLGWYYLSFANEFRFLGAAIVWARGLHTAVERARQLGIHPGGQVACWSIPKEDVHRVPADMRNRLLSEAEVIELDGK